MDRRTHISLVTKTALHRRIAVKIEWNFLQVDALAANSVRTLNDL